MIAPVRRSLIRAIRGLVVVLVGFGGILVARELHLTYTVLTDGFGLTTLFGVPLNPVPARLLDAIIGGQPQLPPDLLPPDIPRPLVLLPISDFLVGALAGIAVGRLTVRNVTSTVVRESPVGADEEIVAVVRPSWTNWSGLGLLALLALAGGVVTVPAVAGLLPVDVPTIVVPLPFLPDEADQLAGLFLGGSVAAIIGGVIALARRRSQYLITDRRVINRRGLLRTTTTDLPLDRVRSVDTTVSLRDRLFGRGTLLVQPHTGDPLELPRIPRPNRIADAIHEHRSVVQYQQPTASTDSDE